MMFWLGLLMAQPSVADALSIYVLGIQSKPVLKAHVRIRKPLSVGTVSHLFLEKAVQKNKLTHYNGSETGVRGINLMTTTKEIISPTEVKFYGWCYRVNGQSPGFNADRFMLTRNDHTLEWYYGYAHLKDGRWLTACAPADHLPQSAPSPIPAALE